MCGIYGVYAKRGNLSEEQIDGPRDRLTHRGPDDSGSWISPDRRLGLGHRRLSIVDLSPSGHQPMCSGDRRYIIVFNGEIYNFHELRKLLEAEGARFASHSDTEVILAAYQRWGEACLDRFNGMFAFVIYDAGDNAVAPSLFMARDRAGKKPFYYAHQPGEFRFASELKALAPFTGLSLQGLNHYLALGYVPGAQCIVDGVCKLPPAHCARLDLRTERLTIRRYWQLPVSASDVDADADGDALTEEVERLLLDATRLRLQADVPVGVLLSGGLDSSLVTAAAAKSASGTIRTFSIAVPGSDLDESERAAQIACEFGTDHQALPLDLSGLAALDDIAPFVDEPLADSSLIPAYLVSRLTRQSVTVALGGDGGDELFGGYDSYAQSLRDARRLGWAPASLLAGVAKAASCLPAGVRGRNRIAAMRGGPLQQMIWSTPYFDSVLRSRILSAPAWSVMQRDAGAPERGLLALYGQGSGPVDAMTRMDFGGMLPDDFLVKVDRASMMASLEVRAPYLDYRLIEFAFGRIPARWKVTENKTRLIQRKLARRWLPANFADAPKKGFSIPLDAWLRKAAPSWHNDWLDRLPGVINRDAARGLLRGLLAGRANGSRIFALIMLGYAAHNLGFSR